MINLFNFFLTLLQSYSTTLTFRGSHEGGGDSFLSLNFLILKFKVCENFK